MLETVRRLPWRVDRHASQLVTRREPAFDQAAHEYRGRTRLRLERGTEIRKRKRAKAARQPTRRRVSHQRRRHWFSPSLQLDRDETKAIGAPQQLNPFKAMEKPGARKLVAQIAPSLQSHLSGENCRLRIKIANRGRLDALKQRHMSRGSSERREGFSATGCLQSPAPCS